MIDWGKIEDCELFLTYAAKAAGGVEVNGWGKREEWNPLESDADAFRLAVKLCMEIEQKENMACVCKQYENFLDLKGWNEPHENDPCAATRRAIVFTAAQIGEDL